MLDLETMGTGPTSAIVAVGAVLFNKDKVVNRFYRTIDLKDSELYGDIDGSTVMWWMKQSQQAREEIFKANNDLIDVLEEFSKWLPAGVLVWGNGSDFDNVILANAYKACCITQPWRYSHNRCFRTVKAMNESLNVERIGVYHNALDDAENQAIYLIQLGVLDG